MNRRRGPGPHPGVVALLAAGGLGLAVSWLIPHHMPASTWAPHTLPDWVHPAAFLCVAVGGLLELRDLARWARRELRRFWRWWL